MNKNKIFSGILLFLIIIIISCSINEKVRVNIIGYPKLDSFEIKLNKKSKLLIDNKNIISNKLLIKPDSQTIILNNSNKIPFKKIKITSNGIITFISNYGDQQYKGDFLISSSNDSIQIINIIGIDDYFASVLGSEMGESFSEEALKAQAIAIRTYYYSRKKEYKNEPYDINNADGRDIVYRGDSFASGKMYEIMKKISNQFLLDEKNKLTLPLFHSTSGGIILKDKVLKSNINENITDPVLLYDHDDYGIPLSINSPYYYFIEKINENHIKNMILPIIKIDKIIDINLIYFNKTNCVNFIGFVDQNNNNHFLKAYKFLSLAQREGFNDLRSIQFKINKAGDYYFFKGEGFGHLCGMSQYSAEQLAKKGYTYIEILKKYYPEYRVAEKRHCLFSANIFYDN